METRKQNDKLKVYRQTPKCTFCGEPTHKVLNRDMSNVPISERVYGIILLVGLT